jgi:RNA polymerase sigma-70 factor (ECF subfamily)
MLVHDTDVAQEIVQEAYVRVWASKNTPSAEAEFRRYLYRTITNLAHNYRRQQLRTTIRQVSVPSPVNPLDEVDRRAGDADLRAAIRGLSLRERQAVYLHYYEDHSFAETARIMGAPQVTVRVIVHRALGKLRRKLNSNITTDKVAI